MRADRESRAAARADSALFLGWAYVERAIAECKRAIERLALDSVQAAG